MYVPWRRLIQEKEGIFIVQIWALEGAETLTGRSAYSPLSGAEEVPMTGNVKKTILPEKLLEASDNLKRESDALTSSLRQVEKSINSLGPGIEAALKEPILKEDEFVEDDKGGYYQVKWEHFLGYGRCIGKSKREWGIYVDTGFNGETNTIRGISELPRELRMAAAKHLPRLLDLLAEEAEKMLKDVQSAKLSAEDAVRRLGSK
jgi:hypothetical protein